MPHPSGACRPANKRNRPADLGAATVNAPATKKSRNKKVGGVKPNNPCKAY